MIEIRVQCLCTAIQLPDLGEKLFKGDVLFLAKDRADKSRDLTTAKMNGAVRCQEVIRCQEQRPAPVPVVNPYLPANKPSPQPQIAPRAPVASPAVVREVAERVVQALNKTAVVVTPIDDGDGVEDVLGPIMGDEPRSADTRKRRIKKGDSNDND